MISSYTRVFWTALCSMIDRLFLCHDAYVVAACSFLRHPVYSIKFGGAGSCVSRDLQEKITFRVYLHILILCMCLHICLHMCITYTFLETVMYITFALGSFRFCITASECNTKKVLHSESRLLNVIPKWYYIQDHCF